MSISSNYIIFLPCGVFDLSERRRLTVPSK
jgi:hypothetical protein